MNDIIKGALELRDKNGNFKKHYLETSADMVKMPNNTDTTVADVLSGITLGTAEYADEAGQAEKDSEGNVISTTYAPINSPNFTGVPTAPTSENLDLLTNQVATVAWANNVFKRFTGIVPENMDTLQEFWNALGQDSDLSTTLATELSKKLDSDTSLTSISNLNLTADKTLYTSAANVFSATDCTAFARQLLATTGAKAARKILGVNADPLFDECGNVWDIYGTPYFSAEHAKFVNALQSNSAGLIYNLAIPWGDGEDFSLEFWNYLGSSTPDYGTIFSISSTRDYKDAAELYRAPSTTNLNFKFFDATGTQNNDAITAGSYFNSLCHYELNYSADAKILRLFIDGALVASKNSVELSGATARIQLGGSTMNSRTYSASSLSEVRISHGICRHVADFTPPTAPYEVDSYTYALLHFGGE